MRSLDRNIVPQIQHLLTSPFNGTCFKPLLLRDAQTSAPAVFREQNIIDHFKLHIPYAGYGLVWGVRFDSNCPELAPDFLLDDDTFTSSLNIDKLCEGVPTLEKWDPKNSDCLRNVIQELLNLYTLHQLQRLEKEGSSLADECSKLVQKHELGADQIQVLSGDFPTLPHYTGSSRPPRDTVSILILHVEKLLNCEDMLGEMAIQFNVREYSSDSVVLHLSPGVRNLLGDDECEFEIPNIVKSEGIASYFDSLLQMLTETFSQQNQAFEQRKEFHTALALELSRLDNITVIPLESDKPDFTTSSFLLEIDNFNVTLIVKTPRNSHANPKIYLRTITGSCQEVKDGCVWDSEKAIEAIMNSLMDMKDD